MQIYEDYNLEKLNSFRIFAESRYYCALTSIRDLEPLLNDSRINKNKILCMGSGSNMLFVDSFQGLIIHNQIQGIEIVEETSDFVKLKVGAGVIWNNFVEWTISKNLNGIENLVLIPGTVGAAPIQNIGAYGIEVKDTIESVEAFNFENKNIKFFNKDECQFGYRDSIFKTHEKGKWLITSVVFRLSKRAHLHTHYGAIATELKLKAVIKPSIRDVADAVIKIRRSKLPDPELLGNAGSFFKNPIIPSIQFLKLKEEFPLIVAYPDREGFHKIAAGWLIEAAGMKGYTEGSCGVHQSQSLVLVNYGGATGRQILTLADKVRRTVKLKFHITLEVEVNIIGDSVESF